MKSVRVLAISALSVSLFVASAAPACAGNFGVSPLDVQFSPQQKSAVLTITNDDSRPVSLRLRAMRWTQGANGRDIYEESRDLIFFPKRIEAQSGESKIVRVGVGEIAPDREHAYRLFIEELPPPRVEPRAQSLLSILITIGVPVFVSAGNVHSDLAVSNQQWVDGKLQLSVVNSGGARARISRIVTDTGVVVTEGLDGRYVFPGITKVYTVTPPAKICDQKTGILRLETDSGIAEVPFVAPPLCGA